MRLSRATCRCTPSSPILDGVTKGSKVQVAGMDAGQVTGIEVPRSPSGHFRVQMKVDEQLHGLVRTDSVVTIDTEGVVGDTFLTIHSGSPNAAIAQADSVLQSKPPVTMSDLLTHGLGIMNDADATIKQVGGKLNSHSTGSMAPWVTQTICSSGSKRAAGQRA